MKSVRGQFLRLNLIGISLCVVLIGGAGPGSLAVLPSNASHSEIRSMPPEGRYPARRRARTRRRAMHEGGKRMK